MKKLILFTLFFIVSIGIATAQDFPTTSSIFFPEATISIDLPDSWQVSKKRTNYPHLVEASLYEDENTAVFTTQYLDTRSRSY